MDAKESAGDAGLLDAHYWDEAVAARKLPIRQDLRLHDVDLYGQLRRRIARPGLRLLEVGCAPGGWLAYFAREFGCQVAGFDQSAASIAATERNLGLQGVEAELWQADLMDEQNGVPRRAFDLVISVGVIEHFPQPEEAVERLAEYAAPGGLVVTSVPNVTSVQGRLMRLLDPRRYAGHQPIEPARLRAMHAGAGLEVTWCRYSGSYAFRELERGMDARLNRKLNAILRFPARGLSWLSRQAFARIGGTLPSRLLNRNVSCIAGAS